LPSTFQPVGFIGPLGARVTRSAVVSYTTSDHALTGAEAVAALFFSAACPRPIGHDQPADPPHRHPVNGQYRPYASQEIQVELQIRALSQIRVVVERLLNVAQRPEPDERSGLSQVSAYARIPPTRTMASPT
jgi:hypothetical protein